MQRIDPVKVLASLALFALALAIGGCGNPDEPYTTITERPDTATVDMGDGDSVRCRNNGDCGGGRRCVYDGCLAREGRCSFVGGDAGCGGFRQPCCPVIAGADDGARGNEDFPAGLCTANNQCFRGVCITCQ